jgi:signal transduction histidine kinase
MFTRWRLGTPLRLSLLFVLVAGTLLAALAWLWQSLLADERRVARTQQTERLHNAASLLTREIERTLASWETLAASALQDEHATPPSQTALIVFDANGVIRTAGVSLPYLPALPRAPEPRSPALSLAAVQEFRTRDLPRAATLYRQAAATADRPARAAALLGLARVRRQQQQDRDAISVYGELAALGDTQAGGFPAELLARRERGALLLTLGDKRAGREEIDHVTSSLLAGRFRIDRATFDLFVASLAAKVPYGPARSLADAATELWPRWQQGDGRITTTIRNRAVLATWQTAGGVSAAVVGAADALMSPMRPLMRDLGVDVSLQTTTGAAVFGGAVADDVSAERSLRDIGLPWSLRLASATSAAAHSAWTSRRNLLSAGFVLMALVIATASYTVFRSVDRELGVARLQSDFVAAVSHEFRSPLTAMRHLTDVLEEGTASANQLPQYYQALGKETRRLHGLVEHLLDFGRMQAGRREYCLEPVDAVALAREVVDEFSPHAASLSHQIECSAPSGPLTIRADRAALALALRNLMDNAVKYSPAGSTVTVSVAARGDRVGIGVEDHGDGIPPSEQRGIFGQFVRGSLARTLHVKGTGIGLTMADRIVTAHGGRLDLRSETAKGSTFTMWLALDGANNETGSLGHL